MFLELIDILLLYLDNQFGLSTKASPMNIPVKPMRPPMRSSIEGLNQEIEGLVLKSAANPSDPDHPVEDKVRVYLYLWWCINIIPYDNI